MERNITYIALFAALIAALGLIPKITLAGGVPITAQSLGIMLCGTILGARRGFLAVLLFVVLVALGLPLLSGGRGGLGVFQGASVGFVIGFPFAAFVAGLIVEKWRAKLEIGAFVGAVLGGILVLYAFGIPGWAYTTGTPLVDVAKACVIFLPGDLIKAIIAAALTGALYKASPSSVLSRQ